MEVSKTPSTWVIAVRIILATFFGFIGFKLVEYAILARMEEGPTLHLALYFVGFGLVAVMLTVVTKEIAWFKEAAEILLSGAFAIGATLIVESFLYHSDPAWRLSIRTVQTILPIAFGLGAFFWFGVRSWRARSHRKLTVE